MIVSDKFYYKLGREIVEPFDKELVQPASYELTLAGTYYKLVEHYLDPHNIRSESFIKKEVDRGVYIEPGLFYLFSTEQKITIPNGFCGEVTGKSTLGRMGLKVHSTAGFIDPGFSGNITLEVESAAAAILLRKGMKVAQLILHRAEESEYLYGERNNHYQGQVGATLPTKDNEGLFGTIR